VCREVLDERNFLLSKWAHLLAGSDDLPEQDIIFAQGHVKDGSDAGQRDASLLNHRVVDLSQVGAVSEAFAREEASSRVIGP